MRLLPALLAAAATLAVAVLAQGTLPVPRSAARPSDAPELLLPARQAAEPARVSVLALDPDAPGEERLAHAIATEDAGLVARLKEPGFAAAIERALGEHAPPEVIDRIKRRLLHDPDPAVRASGLRILALTGDPRHGDDVRALLGREAEWEPRHAAIGALGRFGDAETLVALSREGGPAARAACLALTEVRDADALRRAARSWPELDGDARSALLRAAAEAGPVLADKAKEGLLDADERVRLAAMDLLAGAGDDGIVPLLDHALRGQESELAIRALAALGTPRAAEAGLRALAALPARRQERYRAAFLAALGR
jgi:HEAT repeat protein